MIHFGFEVDVPRRPEELARRDHNRFVKESLRECLKEHHEKRIPGHFTKSAHQKYHYIRRSEKYMRWKARRFHSTTDLVKTGASRDQMKTGRITVGGAAEGGKDINAKLTLRFVFKGGTGRFHRDTPMYRRITILQMHKEIQAMTDDERRAFAEKFSNDYWDRVAKHNAGRKRYHSLPSAMRRLKASIRAYDKRTA